MPPKNKFTEAERVLCFHGPLLYEAKCVKSEVKDKTTKYFIHYNGWNKSWDEWVPESRVLKYGDAALQKQKELKKAHDAKGRGNKLGKNIKEPGKPGKGRPERGSEKEKDTKEKEKDKDKDRDRDSRSEREERRESRASTPIVTEREGSKRKSSAAASASLAVVAPSSNAASPAAPAASVPPQAPAAASDGEPKKKRPRGEPSVESEEHFLTKIEVKVKVPDELKPWLVDDWDLIMHQKQLMTLPGRHTVESVLEDYVKIKLAKANNPNKEATVEVVGGVREYFNVMLGTQLLYKFERPQYAEVLADHPDTPMTSIYGPIHLMRLFVKLGGMLAYTPLDDKSITLLLSHIHDILRYMCKNSSTLFNINDWVIAPPEYHRKAL